MAQLRSRSSPFPGEVILGGEYRLRVTNTEEFECDGNRHCRLLVLDFLNTQTRYEVPCPYCHGMDGHAYCSDVWRFLSGLFPADPLVRDLFLFIMDFAMREHSCPWDGPRRIRVPHVSVVPMVTEIAMRSFEEATVRTKRATDESIRALEIVVAEDVGKDGSCVICFDGLDRGLMARMPCGHVFHRDCIGVWLESSHVCPLCRFEMPTISS